MDLEGEQLILAPRQQVWDALNDPAVLLECIPGCEELAKINDNELEALVLAKVGPVRARFKGKVKMSDQRPPFSYTLHFDGSGGVAGIASGQSVVTLHEEGEQTRLHYTVQASVGGKLGQIGGRLIDSSAKKMAADFFRTFNNHIAPTSTAETTESHITAASSDSTVLPSTDAAKSGVSATQVTTAQKPGWTAEFQRILWLGIGIAIGAGLAHLWHV